MAERTDVQESRGDGRSDRREDRRAVAIVGMAGRFPGARDPEEMWAKLRAGVDSIRRTTVEEQLALGVDPARARDPRFVPAHGTLDGDVAAFDAALFGMSPREAEATDPQHRLLLECAWETLERAGYGGRLDGLAVGVYAGAGSPGYLHAHLLPRGDLRDPGRRTAARLGNEPDYLATRLAYKLDLRGPSLTVQTACSTSLVAVALACQSLLTWQCDLALAGGVSLGFPVGGGYLYEEGGIVSPDGRCRAFDASARGTVPADGVGLVLLKRLSEALADGDHVHAVLLAAATNNDGAHKVGFSAPGLDGQAEVVAMAHALAGVEARSIGYVEAHGTGTRLGDPIEVAALTQVFRETTGDRGFCALGSIKSNLGHANAAAGIAGLLKTALALEHGEIPPSLHFERPNPEIDFAASPFFVNAALRPWPREEGAPRRAGVSAFGFGGTNAHVVLEEAPTTATTTTALDSSRPVQLLTLSARTGQAVEAIARRLADHLVGHPEQPLADVAFTLHTGRRELACRQAVVGRDAAECARALREGGLISGRSLDGAERPVVLMFPGQGAQREGMAAALCSSEPGFRAHFEEACARLSPHLGPGLRGRKLHEVVPAADAEALRRTELAQPALFAVEYALARTFLDFGVRPRAMIGHSLGEYVAACLAGVFTLEEAARLVAARGRLMQALPPGAMLAAPLAPEELAPLLDPSLSIAAENGPCATVASGPLDSIEVLARRLEQRGTPGRRLATSHAFHSAMVEPALDGLRAELGRVRLRPPSIPFVSNLTGDWISEEEAVDPERWVRHARQAVRFHQGLRTLAALDGEPLLLEVGPGRGLCALAERSLGTEAAARTVSSLGAGGAGEGRDDDTALQTALGRLWVAGVRLDWRGVHAGERRRRVILPTYPFEKKRYWVAPPGMAAPPIDCIDPADPVDPAPAAAATGEQADDATIAALAETEARLRERLAIPTLDAWPGLREGLHALCTALVVRRCLVPAGIDLAEGNAWRRAELCDRLGVVPGLRRLLDAALDGLVEDGVLAAEGDTLRATGRSVGDPGELGRDLRRRFPGFVGILDLLERAVAAYPDALSGRIEAISVLYPGGRADLARDVASRTAEHRDERVYLELAVEATRRLVAEAAGRRLRILEVGGGQGALTWKLVEALAGAPVDYHFTDLGGTFVDDARAEAERRGLAPGGLRMSFGRLDASRDPAGQGLANESFDLVLALDVVHATPDVAATLGHLRRLVAPGGALLLVEAQSIERWDVLTWGLAEGWWYFADGREGSPLLPLDRWEALCRGAGFAHVAGFPRSARERARAGHALVLARREAASSRAASPDAPSSGAAAPASRSHSRPELPTPWAPPATPLERELAALCAEVLGLDRVGADDDFFALGGDSLIALRLSDRIRKDLGLEVAEGAIFRGTTVRKLARALGDGARPGPSATVDDDSPLVTLQPRGRRRPVFFVHPAAGVVFPYVELSRLLGPEQPFHAMQARGLRGEGDPDTTVEAMAARYLEAMRAVQPSGPYRLGGFSFGGLVAFEMAQQLARAGEAVDLLAVVDEPAPLPGYRPTGTQAPRLVFGGLLRSIWPHLHDYLYLRSAARPAPRPRRLTLPDLGDALRRSNGAVHRFVARATMANLVPPESQLLALDQPAILPMFELFLLHIRLSHEYQPSAYPGRITVLKASEIGGAGRADPTMGWGVLAAGGVECHRVPGEHLTILRQPHVRVVAERLARCLDGLPAG